MEEEDPLDAYMRKIDVFAGVPLLCRLKRKQGWRSQIERTMKTCNATSKKRRRRKDRTKLLCPQLLWMIFCMFCEDIPNRNNENKDESTQMDEEEEEKYHKAFKEAIQRAVEAALHSDS